MKGVAYYCPYCGKSYWEEIADGRYIIDCEKCSEEFVIVVMTVSRRRVNTYKVELWDDRINEE